MADRIKGITVEIAGDTTKLSSALRDVDKTIKDSQKDLKDLNKALKLDPKNVELLKQKQEILNTEIEASAEKLDMLKTAQEQAAEEMANGSEEAKRNYELLTREIATCQAQMNKMQSDAEDTNKAIEDANGIDLNALDEKLKKTGDKIEKVGNAATIASAGIVALGAAAVSAFNDVDTGADIVIKKTGATGEAAEELQAVYEEVAQNVVTSFDAAGAAVGEINTRWGYTGFQLQTLSEEFLKFSHITDQDVNSAIVGVDKAMKTFNVDSSETKNVLGLLAQTAQSTGIDVSTLEGLLQSSGAALQEMGLGLGESVQLMGALEQSGADASTVISGMKKAAAEYAKDGKDMNTELSSLIGRLQDAETEADATEEAFSIFGSKAGLTFVNLAKQGKISLDDLGTDYSKYGTVVDKTYQQTLSASDEMTMVGNQAKVALGKLGETIGKTLMPLLEKLSKAIEKIADWFDSLSDDEKSQVVNIGLIVAAAGPAIKIIGKVISLGKSLAAVFNPITGIVAAAIGMTTALIVAADPMEKELEAAAQAMAGWDENAKALRNHLEEAKEKLDDLASAQAEQANTIEDETTKTTALWGELQKIVEENGHIKKGYEERAAVIAGALSEALGTEISIVDGQIVKYQELKNSVDEVIQSKRLQLLLEASNEEYLDALTNINGKQEQAIQAEQALNDAKEKRNSIEQEWLTLQEKYQNGGDMTLEERDRYFDLNNQMIELNASISKLSENYSLALREYGQYQMTLDAYDKAMAAATAGSLEEMQTAADGMVEMMSSTEEDFTAYGEGLVEDAKDAVVRSAQAVNDNAFLMQSAFEGMLDPINAALDETLNKMIALSNASNGKLSANVLVTNNNTLTLDGQVVARSVNRNLGGIMP